MTCGLHWRHKLKTCQKCGKEYPSASGMSKYCLDCKVDTLVQREQVCLKGLLNDTAK